MRMIVAFLRPTLRHLAITAVVVCLFLYGRVSCASAATGTFVHALAARVSSLDPAKSNSVDDDQVMWLIYEALAQLSADGTSLIPALAERWETSGDGLTYTFTLRRNVRFHDGSLVDADAVKASYERQYLKTSPFYTSRPSNVYDQVLSRLVKEVRVLGSHTVAITTQFPMPSQFAIVKIVSAKALREHKGDLSRSPNGTGPYMLRRWEDDRLVLAPFLDYWQGKPKLDEVQFSMTSTSEAQLVERLASGESHLLTHVPPDYLEQLRANSRVQLTKYGGLNTMFVGMNVNKGPLKDRRVREAIVRSIDRERMVTVLGRGAMIPAKSALPPACAGFEHEVIQPQYDPERARDLLKAAGFSSLRLRLLYTSPTEFWSEIVHAVRADLERVGITVEPWATASWPEYHAERKKLVHDLYLRQWVVSTPEPERILNPLFHSQSPDNSSQLADPRIDNLLDQARRPMRGDERLRLYAQVNRLVVEDLPAIFLGHRIGIAAVNSRVRDLTLNLYGLPQDKLVNVEIR